MRERIVPVAAVVGALSLAGGAGAANGDFPEQPGTHNAQGCAAVATNPGALPVAAQHSSPTSQAIVLERLFPDACLGLP